MTKAERSDLEKLAATIEDLPTLPEVAISIFNLIEDPKSSARDIQRVMSEDPALAGKVLRLVNSAYFGFAHKISDLGHAIVILGFATIRSIAMGISIIETFKDNPGRKATGFDVEKFWMHAVGMGLYVVSWHGIYSRHLDKNKVAFEWALSSSSESFLSST